MQNKENLPINSDIPLLTWHLPNKEQDIIEEAENSLLKREINGSNSNKNENKENIIPYRCNKVKSSSGPTDSEYTNAKEENFENRGKNVQQRHDNVGEEEITRIGERLNHSLCMRSSNNDSTASQKVNYNLRERNKEIKFIEVKNRDSFCSQRRRVTKRKLPSDFSEDSVVSKRGRKHRNTSTENSLESTNFSAQKLKCTFMEMETTLSEVNQLIVNWIKGLCGPLERQEALTLLHTIQNIYETLLCRKQMIKVVKTLGKKKPLQQYVNKLLKDSEYLHKKLSDIIYECDMKHLKFTEESEKENEILLKSVSTKRSRSLYSTKKATKNIKSILKTTNNHFKNSKKLSFSKKYINIYDDNTMSQRSFDSDQDMCLGEDSYSSHSNDMHFEEIDEAHKDITESIDVSHGYKMQDFNSAKKLLVNESCLKQNTQLSAESERTPNIMEQNSLNIEINAFGDNISNQLLQNSSNSQIKNSENTRRPGNSLTFNRQDYLINYDQSLLVPSSDSNLIQTEESMLKMSLHQENDKLCDNSNNESQLLTGIEQMQRKNINLQESCATKSRNSTENKEKQNKQINMNTVQIQKPERFNEEIELLPQEPLVNDDLNTPITERNPNSDSMNVSQNKLQAVTNISENSSNLGVNNNKTFYTTDSQIQKQKYINNEIELLVQDPLINVSLNAADTQIKLIDSNQNVFEAYSQPAINDISENNSKLIFANNNNTALNANIFHKKDQERTQPDILPERKIIHGSLNISQTSIRPTMNDTLNYNSNPVLANNKTIHDPNTSRIDLNTTQSQKQEQLKETMGLQPQNALSTDTLKATCTQRNPNSSSYDIKSSIKQPKKGKCFVKKQSASRKKLIQPGINISNLEKSKIPHDKDIFLCNQCTLHTQNGNSDAIFNNEMNGEQNPNNSNEMIKRSTNFKTYKKKRINKSIIGEIGSEISQQNYKQILLAKNQNTKHQLTLQKLALDNTKFDNIHDKSIYLKNNSKIIITSSLEKMDTMETVSDLLPTEPSLSISEPIKDIEYSFKDVDISNNDQNLSTELKIPVNYLQNDPLFPPFACIPNDNPQLLNSEIQKISINEQTIGSNNNNAVITMNGSQDRKDKMKNQEFQGCSENLLHYDTYTNFVQEKIQSSSCSEIIPATIEGIKSIRIKSKDEFVIIQDLNDLITADEFIW